MGQWSSSDVIANGVRLHVYRTGGAGAPASRPPLVLAHAASEQASSWFRVARILEGDYDIIMYDARSHGLSETAPLAELEDLAADLSSLVQALHLQQPYIMGASMGALTVALAASLDPQLARAVILEDISYDIGFWTEEWAQQGRTWRLPLKSATRDQWVAFFRARWPTWHEDDLASLADGNMHFAVEHLHGRRGPNIMMLETVRQITCPVLMLVGDADKGGKLTPEMEREFAQIGGNVRVVHVAGAGHQIKFYQHEAFMQIVSAFLREQAASAEK